MGTPTEKQARSPHSDKTRARISRGLKRHHERRRKAATVRPAALERLRGSGIVAPELRPLVAAAEAEMLVLVESLGGVQELTAQRRALIEDVVSVGIVLRGELGRYLADRDPEAGARVATMANSRRASLMALGLDVAKKDPLDVDGYTAAIEKNTRGTR